MKFHKPSISCERRTDITFITVSVLFVFMGFLSFSFFLSYFDKIFASNFFLPHFVFICLACRFHPSFISISSRIGHCFLELQGDAPANNHLHCKWGTSHPSCFCIFAFFRFSLIRDPSRKRKKTCLFVFWLLLLLLSWISLGNEECSKYVS